MDENQRPKSRDGASARRLTVRSCVHHEINGRFSHSQQVGEKAGQRAFVVVSGQREQR